MHTFVSLTFLEIYDRILFFKNLTVPFFLKECVKNSVTNLKIESSEDWKDFVKRYWMLRKIISSQSRCGTLYN